MARRPREARSFRRSGAREPMPPIWMAMLAKLAMLAKVAMLAKLAMLAMLAPLCRRS